MPSTGPRDSTSSPYLWTIWQRSKPSAEVFAPDAARRCLPILLNVSDPEPAIKSVDPNWSGALPATFLYNEKGEVVFKHFGRVKPDELRAAIEKK